MGDFMHRSGRRTVAILLVAAVAVVAVVVAVLRPSEQERFRSWLRDQPDVVSVDEPARAVALGVAGVAGRVFEPTDRAVVAVPLDVAVVDRLARAIVAYAAAHPSLSGPAVELRQGRDVVLVGARPGTNATTLRVLGAMRDLPGVVAVQIAVRSGSAPFTATVETGSDLPAAVTTLAGAVPHPDESWVNGPPSVAVRDPEGHEVRVLDGGTVSASDRRAFALAVRLAPARAVTLTVSGTPSTDRRSVIRLPGPGLVAEDVDALHRSGFGLSRFGEVVEGPVGPVTMDEQAWATSAAAQLRRDSGAVAVTVDPGTSDTRRPVTADLRVTPDVSFPRVLAALPEAVEQVELHTSPAPPDYDRDDALAPDPEVDCPDVGHGLNLAYTGPPGRLGKAANYLAALRAGASGATCVHWAEADEHGRRPTTQTLLVRLPLREASWRPLLDVVRARRADLGSAHPTVLLLLPVPGTSVTGLVDLAEGQAPSVSALDTDSQGQTRAVQDALQPLVRYWARG
ncbi:hypothetical protein ASD62_07070 [Phycicoccus sp. Root563]|uniref:hypothetical protein n=1 Tax=Phycicoccus sp. Root563 TaxID=1736562 RepID=UPI00070304B3|nr:hypothetical protein [Phycicoccus sp. Root563]KQZ89102.1 hypothetical protein ASD62_07070 [Phycicoccus sp. Root563]